MDLKTGRSINVIWLCKIKTKNDSTLVSLHVYNFSFSNIWISMNFKIPLMRKKKAEGKINWLFDHKLYDFLLRNRPETLSIFRKRQHRSSSFEEDLTVSPTTLHYPGLHPVKKIEKISSLNMKSPWELEYFTAIS